MAYLGAAGLLSFVSYFYFVIPLPVVIYLLLKWRAYRDSLPPDPRLGMKVTFHYFKTLAYQLVLLALALVFLGLQKGGYPDEMKTGLGLLVGGGLVFGAFYLLKTRVAGESQLVARVYGGVNVLVAGLLAMASLIALCVMLFNGSTEEIRLPLSGLLVYGVAFLFQGSYFFGFPNLGGKKTVV